MTEGPEANGAPPSDGGRAHGEDLFGLEGLERRAALDWVGKNLPYVRRTALGQRPI